MSDSRLEKAVVGAAMRDRTAFQSLAKIIKKPETFSSFSHQVAWKAMAKMNRESLPFDAVTLSETLIKTRNSDDCPPAYLIELWESAPSLDVSHHARTLVDLWLKRQIAETMRQMQDDIGDSNVSPLHVIDRVKAEFERVASHRYESDDTDNENGAKKFHPFPVENVPSSLADFILASAEALGCEPTFIAVPSLVSVAASIGTSRMIALKDSWQEPSVIWAATVADSSSMKSPSMDMAVAPLWSIQREMSLEFESDQNRYKQALDEWNNARFAKHGKGTQGDDAPKPDRPSPRKLIVSDITVEKLAHVMWQNPQGVVLCRDELSGWFGSFGRYADAAGPSADMSMWLEIFRAKTLVIDRKTSDPPCIYVPRASCSVVGTIQPKVLARILTDQFFESGMASRLLVCMPPKKAKEWNENVVPQVVYDEYANKIREIYVSGQEILASNKGEPKVVTFTPAGKKAWIGFYKEWADRQANADGEYAYALAKLEAYCARFCLLFSVFDKAGNSFRREDVTEGHVRKAFDLVKWFASEAERVYKMIREPAENGSRDKLIDFIKAIGGEVSPRRLLRSNPAKYQDADSATRVLDGLVEKNLGKWKTVTSEGKGGRPGRVFIATPDTIKT